MNRNPISLLAGVLLFGSFNLRNTMAADNWQDLPARPPFVPMALVADSAGRLHAAGRGGEGASVAVYEPADAAAQIAPSWQVEDTYVAPGGSNGAHRGLCATASGELCAAGAYGASDGFVRWVVRGTSLGRWQTLDSDYGVNLPSEAWGVASAADGALLVTGNAQPSSKANGQWIVRKSLPGANPASSASWQTVDAVSGGAGLNSARAIDILGNQVIVVGQVADLKSGTLIWTVRKSNSGGAPNSWATVDTFQLSAGGYAGASGIARDSTGRIYVAGRAQQLGKGRTPAVTYWVIRSSSTGENGTWTTLSQIQYDSWPVTIAIGITVDPFDNVFAAGYSNSGSLYRWLVTTLKASAPATGWATSDDLASSRGARPITHDAFGNIFAGGTDLAGAPLVRVLAR